MRGFHMNIRTSAALVAVLSSLALSALAVPAAQANVLSILPGSCGNQDASQPFAQWGDRANYTLVPGGTFEAGSPPWILSRGAAVIDGNESYYVHDGTDERSLSLPSGSSATSWAVCTSIYHPTARLFVKNTGSASSRLKVEALYPGLLGGVQVARLGNLSGNSEWKPTPTLPLTVTNLLATLSLDRTAIAYRFSPADASGKWSIDDVYVDPRMK
jgi:hypothetical protein